MTGGTSRGDIRPEKYLLRAIRRKESAALVSGNHATKPAVCEPYNNLDSSASVLGPRPQLLVVRLVLVEAQKK
jgi:hypothetical protein